MGNTDELGYRYIEDDEQLHVHDLHATMLRLCGLDHKRLTYRYQGRDFRLTDVSGKVAEGFWREPLRRKSRASWRTSTG